MSEHLFTGQILTFTNTELLLETCRLSMVVQPCGARTEAGNIIPVSFGAHWHSFY